MKSTNVRRFTASSLRDLGQREWVGLANYTDVLTDGAFWSALWLTMLYVITVVPIHIGLGLALANLLDRVGRARGFYLAGLLLPFVATPVEQVADQQRSHHRGDHERQQESGQVEASCPAHPVEQVGQR
ncbi:MAG: hypothetical protein AAFN30_10640, partial [Actinomycetota bacterium]